MVLAIARLELNTSGSGATDDAAGMEGVGVGAGVCSGLGAEGCDTGIEIGSESELDGGFISILESYLMGSTIQYVLN